MRFRFGVQDASRVRLGYSPLVELCAALKFMQVPELARDNAPFLLDMRARLDERDVALAAALIPARGYIPDFLAPTPATSEPTLTRELDRLAATPPDVVAAELAMASPDGLPGPLAELVNDREDAARCLAQWLGREWYLTLAPSWPRLRSVLEADVAHWSRRVAVAGATGALSRPDELTTWDGSTLTIGTPSLTFDRDLDGLGLVLVSSVFCAPWPAIVCFGDWQPAVHLRARGSYRWWTCQPPPRRSGPAQLLGSTRARIMSSLGAPSTTTGLAADLGIDPAGVSRHLHVLAAAGLVIATRHGRRVLYERTATGAALCEEPTAPPLPLLAPINGLGTC